MKSCRIPSTSVGFQFFKLPGCDGSASQARGVVILLITSCYRNEVMLRQLWAFQVFITFTFHLKHNNLANCVALIFHFLGRTFFEHLGGDCPGILIVQCDSGDDNFNLIAGARHILMEERNDAAELLNLPAIEAVHILLVVQLPRIAGGCRNFVGFQGGKWMSTHIDELRPPGKHTPSIEHLIDRPISELFGSDEQPEKNGSVQSLAVTLLRNCVQAAACRVDDEGGSPERSTHRIELLLELLPEDCNVLEGWSNQ